ncbi:hypothetical protein ACH5RR_021559 [Cinchona calisaya]|uniref:phosphoserine phosphatase n=1 Tax=Cinchona calisaya TaxID=153742 RepID=A0ABD2ZL78_9GENT
MRNPKSFIPSILLFSHLRPQKRSVSQPIAIKRSLRCGAILMLYALMWLAVCPDEGIHELPEFCGAGKAVAEWTARAMGGSVPFKDALAARISPAIDELVKKLKAINIDVYQIFGGFRQMINPVASILGIPVGHDFPNELPFGSTGQFLGFERNKTTTRSGGKATAVHQLRKACKPGSADFFIFYAGVQLQEAVAAKVDWLMFNFKELINA